jgi:hypothetical protein
MKAIWSFMFVGVEQSEELTPGHLKSQPVEHCREIIMCLPYLS